MVKARGVVICRSIVSPLFSVASIVNAYATTDDQDSAIFSLTDDIPRVGNRCVVSSIIYVICHGLMQCDGNQHPPGIDLT